MSGMQLFPARSFQIDNFLTQSEFTELLDFALSREASFVETQTSTGLIGYRKSIVLYEMPAVAIDLTERVKSILPHVLRPLAMPMFEVGDIERQITAHNDGNYYKIHNDNGSETVQNRTISYVYYFYQEPKQFHGGELRVYDLIIENGHNKHADTFNTVHPRNNSLVLFPSHYWHEVKPVVCGSRLFPDSRFTLNGWIRKL